MTDKAKAARLWATIERDLLRRGWIRDGRELREHRADMVRVIGDSLEIGTAKEPGPQVVRARARELTKQVERLPARQGVVTSAMEGEIKRKLDAYIERSTYGARGYDEDDEVGYTARKP
jgi:hypothetical protein